MRPLPASSCGSWTCCRSMARRLMDACECADWMRKHFCRLSVFENKSFHSFCVCARTGNILEDSTWQRGGFRYGRAAARCSVLLAQNVAARPCYYVLRSRRRSTRRKGTLLNLTYGEVDTCAERGRGLGLSKSDRNAGSRCIADAVISLNGFCFE